MKTIFLVFRTDAHISYASYDLVGVFTTKGAAIKALDVTIENAAEESYFDCGYSDAKTFYTDMIFQLNNYNQTQNLSENYVIREQQLNKLDL